MTNPLPPQPPSKPQGPKAGAVPERLLAAMPTPNPKQMGLWHSLTHDWAAKLMALAAACVLWFFASEDRRTIIQQSFDVPVTVRDNTGEAAGEERAVSGLSPSTVKVMLSGRPSRLSEIRGEQIEAVTDITNLPEGSFNEAVKLAAPEGTQIVEMTPERVQGIVDTVQTVTLPVTITAPAPADGQSPTYQTEPAEVNVSGPSRTVNEVEQVIYAPVNLEPGESQTVSLLSLDSEGQPVRDVTLKPPTITVTRTDSGEVPLTPVLPTVSGAAASEATAEPVTTE